MEWENVLPWLCLRDPPGVACLVRRDLARTLRTLVLLILFIYLFIFSISCIFSMIIISRQAFLLPNVTLSPPFLCNSSVVSTRSTISFSFSPLTFSQSPHLAPLPFYLPFVLVSASPSFLVYSFLLFFLGFSRVCRSPVILLGNTIGMDGFKFWFRLQLHRRSSALFSNDSFPAHCSHVGVRKVRDCTISYTAT